MLNNMKTAQYFHLNRIKEVRIVCDWPKLNWSAIKNTNANVVNIVKTKTQEWKVSIRSSVVCLGGHRMPFNKFDAFIKCHFGLITSLLFSMLVAIILGQFNRIIWPYVVTTARFKKKKHPNDRNKGENNNKRRWPLISCREISPCCEEIHKH